jgi:hypothetical protein
LDLTGRFIYAHIGFLPNKTFSVHYDLTVFSHKTNSTLRMRISLSSMYKAGIKATEDHLQIRVTPRDRWAIVVCDVKRLLETNYGHYLTQHSLKTVKICANLEIRGIYTSDRLYTSGTLPKDMQYKITKTENWDAMYDWFFFPHGDKENNPQEEVKRDQFEDQREKMRKLKTNKQEFDKLMEEEKERAENASPQKPKPARFEPSPIMELDRVIGYSGQYCSNVRWCPYGGRFNAESTGNALVYTSGSTIIAMHPTNRTQEILLGHTSDIVCSAVRGPLMVTGESSKVPMVLIWNLAIATSQPKALQLP